MCTRLHDCVDACHRRNVFLSGVINEFGDDAEAHEARSDPDFDSPRQGGGKEAQDREHSEPVLVNSLFCSLGTAPHDANLTVDRGMDQTAQVQAPAATSEKKSGWKRKIMKILAPKAKPRPSAEASTEPFAFGGASTARNAPQRGQSGRRLLPFMLSSTGGANPGGRRSTQGDVPMRGSYMFNTTGPDVMETSQSDWAPDMFNTVGAHPYSMAAPSSVGANPYSIAAPSSVGATPYGIAPPSSVDASTAATGEYHRYMQKQKKKRWWRSFSRT
jgi:hypothetical protein